MSRNKIKSISIDAMFIALIILFTFVPYLGYYTIGPVSFQIIHIFVLIGAALFGYKKGLLYGTVMGICSLLKVLTIPAGWFDLLFLNPLNSILPRMLFGLISGLIFDFLRKNFSQKTFNILVFPFAGILTLLHTALVLYSVYLFSYQDILINTSTSMTFFAFILTSIGLGTLCEAIASVIIVSAIYFVGYKKFGYGKCISHDGRNSYKLVFINYISVIIYLLILLLIGMYIG